jgi:hypothetical protein
MDSLLTFNVLRLFSDVNVIKAKNAGQMSEEILSHLSTTVSPCHDAREKRRTSLFVVQIRSQPSFHFRNTHAFAQMIVLYLVTAEFANRKIF